MSGALLELTSQRKRQRHRLTAADVIWPRALSLNMTGRGTSATNEDNGHPRREDHRSHVNEDDGREVALAKKSW